MNERVMKKTIYFIRHGQSVGNVKKVYQTFDEPLTELGERQSLFVAKRVKTLGAEVILTSTMKRAVHTANIISTETGLKVEEHKNLCEISGPSKLRGLKYGSEESLKYQKKIYENINNPDWRYSDEENTYNAHKRALDVLKLLENRNESKIILITHGAFMKSLLTAMLSKEEYDPNATLKLVYFLKQKNTGITICEYDSSPIKYFENPWNLLVWNDSSHLPEVNENEPT